MKYNSLLYLLSGLMLTGNLFSQDAEDSLYVRNHNLDFEDGVFTGWEERVEAGGAVEITEMDDPVWGKYPKIEITAAQTAVWKYGTGIRTLNSNLMPLDSLVNSSEEVTELKYAVTMWMKKDPSTSYKQVQLRCVFKPNSFAQQVPGPVTLTDDWEKYTFVTTFYKQYKWITPGSYAVYDPAGDTLESILLTIAGGHETGIYYVDDIRIEPYDSVKHYEPPKEPLNNLDFEMGIGIGWTVAADGGVVSIAERASPERGKYLEVHVADIGTSKWPYTQGCSFSDVIPVEKEEVYLVSVLLKSPTLNKSFQMRLPYEADLTGSGWWGQKLSPLVTLTDEWTQYQWYLQIPETVTGSAGEIRDLSGLSMLLGCGGDTGIVHVDDIRFTRVETGPVDQTAAVYYVSGDLGSDSNPGSRESPYRTLQKGLDMLNGNDTLYILEGTYHEELILGSIRGDSAHPVVITSYPGHRVVLDGRIDIDQAWIPHEGSIYKTTLERDIWQLFLDGEMMTSARWPNVQIFSDDTWSWNRKGWRRLNNISSSYGTLVDDAGWNSGNTLAGQNKDFTGAIAILNVYYWQSFVRLVENHAAGQGSFNYRADFLNDPEFYGRYENLYGSWYFLEGSLDMLDIPGEWYYDPGTRELFVYARDGKSPGGRSLKGKVQSFAIKGALSSYVTLKGIDFEATTLSYELCTHMTVEDCRFNYPSYSRRMLRDLGGLDVTAMDNGDKDIPSYNTIRNCEFAWADGSGLFLRGRFNKVENCLFHDLDYSGAPLNFPSNAVLSTNHTVEVEFRDNTIYNTGGSETVGVGERGTYERNDIWNGGMLQGDGTCFQTGPRQFKGTHFRYNWTHDTFKRGIRLDDGGGTGDPGYDAWIYRNVAWNCGYQGLQSKGDSNHVYNNLAFLNRDVDINLVYAPDKNATNTSTFTYNNLGGNISKSQSDPDDIILGIHGFNWIASIENTDLSTHVRDMENRDFRLRPDSPLIDGGTARFGRAAIGDYLGSDPDVGAYEFGDSVYIIPGRRLLFASAPVPKDRGYSNYEFVDLMWRPAYRADSYDVYFGTDSTAVAWADSFSELFRGNLNNNIYCPGTLDAGTKYFWRIDALGKDETVTGSVWSFTAGSYANQVTYRIDFMLYGAKDGNVFPLDSVKIKLSPRQTRTEENGRGVINMVKPGKYHLEYNRWGFAGKADSISIVSDTLISDTLIYEVYSMSIELKDQDSGEPVTGGMILFKNLQLLADSLGRVHVDNVDYGTYILSAEAKDYLPLENTAVEIHSDTTIRLMMTRDYQQVTLKVIDRVDQTPVYRAVIQSGQETLITTRSGNAVAKKVLKGYFYFTITHTDYFTLEDSLWISGDTLITVKMARIRASVIFSVNQGDQPVEDAAVILNQELQQLTGTDGLVRFNNLEARKQHQYEIIKDGYQSVMDSVYLDLDTTIQIQFMPVDIISNPVPEVLVYPNPARDKLYIEIDETAAEFRIIGMDGKVLRIQHIFQGRNTIGLSGLASGMYYIHVQNDTYTGRWKVIVQHSGP